MKKCSAIEIDAILPQTQCGLCGHGGCMPYAKAISESNAPINLCPPGGVETLIDLANLLNQDAAPFIEEMRLKEKPTAIAAIKEAECIGCTKCITACPVDAIIGSAKSMHVVLTDACTGCELCIPPCPVDCIEMIPTQPETPELRHQKRTLARIHFERREKRLQQDLINENKSTLKVEEKKTMLQSYVTAALNRTKNK